MVLVVSTSAFQAERAGSSPVGCSIKKISCSSSFGDWPYIGDRNDVIPVKDVKPDKKRNKVQAE